MGATMVDVRDAPVRDLKTAVKMGEYEESGLC